MNAAGDNMNPNSYRYHVITPPMFRGGSPIAGTLAGAEGLRRGIRIPKVSSTIRRVSHRCTVIKSPEEVADPL